MKLQWKHKSRKKYGKGRYAYATDLRRFVWEEIVWSLFINYEKSYFSLKEYQIKRDQVCENYGITPRQLSGGFISLVNKGILINEHGFYSIHYNLIPFIKKGYYLDYGTMLRETHKKEGKYEDMFLD